MFADPRYLLRQVFQRAVEAADPYQAILRHLPDRPKGRTIVVTLRPQVSM